MSVQSFPSDVDTVADGACGESARVDAPGPPKDSSSMSKASRSQKHKGRRQMDDDFMMRLYKIKLCTRTTPHNWKLCPWAHAGETAALRRDPSTHMAEMCPSVRQHQECPHGEGCLYARNTFECWLHPHRYRTTMCSSGEACTRNICFFAHNEAELRTAPDCADTQPQPQQQWALPGGPDLDAQLLLDIALPAQHQRMGSTGGVLGPMPAGLGEPVCHAMSPAGSHSCPLPGVSLAAAPWCAMVAPGTASMGPVLAPTPPGQPPVTAQQVLLQQPARASSTSSLASPQAAPATAPLPGVLGCMPVSAGMAGVMGLQGAAAIPQAPMVLPGQQASKQFSPAVPTYSISATAGMGGSDSQTSSLMSVVTMGPSPGGSVSDFPALQQLPAEQYAAQDLKWQQQHAAAMQHAALLLQQLQLAGASARRLSVDAVHPSLLQGSSSTLPHLSQLSLSDYSTDSLSALMMSGGYPITQDLGMHSGPLLNSGGGYGQHDMQLLPLESCGLIQLSPLDDGPVAPLQEQRPLPVTMAMPQPGRYW